MRGPGAGRPTGRRRTYPYTDVNGVPFDDAAVAGSDDFPELGPDSFPYQPVVPADQADVKVPAWLNDVTMYHNRGDTKFEGESWTYGDWAGLDDLFTERPEVAEGLIDIYADLIRWTGVDGFRLDSARHVNLEFWQEFVPAMQQAAAEVGVPDFFIFGEVVADYPDMLDYARRSGLPALLDFPLQSAIEQFAEGLPPGRTGARCAPSSSSTWTYADADSDAYASPTFVGNHDMGRIAMRLWGSDPDEESWLHRVHFAYETLFLLRGQPVIYYGDEQGFTGHGGDNLARQDMFASRTPQYLENVRLGTDAGHDVDAYDPSHPTYRLLARAGPAARRPPGPCRRRAGPADLPDRHPRCRGLQPDRPGDRHRVPGGPEQRQGAHPGHDRDLDPERDLHRRSTPPAGPRRPIRGPPPTASSR